MSLPSTADLKVGRAALARIVRIHELLANQRSINATILARELGVSLSTIARDIRTLREELRAEITWDPSTRTYFCERTTDLLPFLTLNAEEALTLVLAGQAFAAWRGTALGELLSSAFEKIGRVLGDSVSFPGDQLGAVLSVEAATSPARVTEQRVFALALHALRQKRTLRFVYRKPGPPESVETRSVHPLHLTYRDDGWLLIAFDPARQGLRNFVLLRMSEVEGGGERFVPPSIDIAAHLRGSMGRYAGDGSHVVRLRFDAPEAPYVRERPWHPSQTVTELPGGGIEATFHLNNLLDVRRRVLSCGPHVEVLAPEELRAAVREHAAGLAARHG